MGFLEGIGKAVAHESGLAEGVGKVVARAVDPEVASPANLSRVFGGLTGTFPRDLQDDMTRYALGHAEEMHDTMPRLVEHMKTSPEYRAHLGGMLDELGVGENVTVYRGGAPSGYGTTNVSLREDIAQGFASTHAQSEAAVGGAAMDDEYKQLGRITGSEEADINSSEYQAAKARRAELAEQRFALREKAATAGAEAKPVAYNIPRSAIIGHGDPMTSELFIDTEALMRGAPAAPAAQQHAAQASFSVTKQAPVLPPAPRPSAPRPRHSSARSGLQTHSSAPARHTNPAMRTVNNYRDLGD